MTRIYLLIIISLAGMLSACAAEEQPHAAPAPLHIADNGVFSRVVSPRVPQKMTFAGQTYDFDRADMYERLDRELTSVCYTHGTTMLLIKRANKYFPVMAPILRKNGVPEDLLYLACVESTLNQRAYSPAKAAGMWQFMAGTAKDYGLEVNDFVDERYNLAKATDAACRYLKRAYSRYGNWESVAASYNGGMARISRELENQMAGSSFDLYLTEETSRYMFRILAMKAVMENPAAYGFELEKEQLYFPADTRTVEVNTPIDDLAAWAKEQGSDYATLRELNPWLRAKSLPNKTGKIYRIELPKSKNELSRRSQVKKSVYNPNWISR